MTPTRDDRANVTPIGDGLCNIVHQLKVTVPQKTPKENNTDKTVARQVDIHVKTPTEGQSILWRNR